ncbi:MAG: NADH-quinone oxidoreductase subunit NuoK [Bacillus sp. (in: Bacteria)]|nr:NADH-quinone oxidoreductase subunit NuoK [Bacillus sp. (in: firmicutes)]
MNEIPLTAYLALALILFCIGIFGALTKKNSLIVLMSIELMLNGVVLNFIAFNRFGYFPSVSGQVFALFVVTIAACEVAVGVALLIALSRHVDNISIDSFRQLKG